MQMNQEPSDEEMDDEEEEARNDDMDLLLGNKTYDQVESRRKQRQISESEES